MDLFALTPHPQSPEGVAPARSKAAPQGANQLVDSFGDILGGLLGNVDGLQKNSEVMTQQLATGEADNVHDVMIAAEQAKMALQFTLAIRRHLLTAYQQISQMR